MIVVCGTNEKTRQALQDHEWPSEGSGVSVRVMGFVSNMDEWMSAADLLVTKVRESRSSSSPWWARTRSWLALSHTRSDRGSPSRVGIPVLLIWSSRLFVPHYR